MDLFTAFPIDPTIGTLSEDMSAIRSDISSLKTKVANIPASYPIRYYTYFTIKANVATSVSWHVFGIGVQLTNPESSTRASTIVVVPGYSTMVSGLIGGATTVTDTGSTITSKIDIDKLFLFY